MNNSKEFREKPTKELIEIIQCSDGPNRDSAFFALVYRFREDLLKFCEIRCKQFGQSPEVAEDLTCTVFESYARKPGFDLSNGKGKNDDDSFLIYLSGIARNALTDIYRKQKRQQEGKWSDGSETIVTALPNLPPNAPARTVLVYKVLNSLSYAHQVIYLTYKSYENTGCKLPRKLLGELRAHLGDISQSTVRTYKKEAVDKIKTALTSLDVLETYSNKHE